MVAVGKHGTFLLLLKIKNTLHEVQKDNNTLDTFYQVLSNVSYKVYFGVLKTQNRLYNAAYGNHISRRKLC